MDNRAQIREFLVSRGAPPPGQAGLPAYGGNRQVAGLRREEVALLAGVSIDYYVRMNAATSPRLRRCPRRRRQGTPAGRRRTRSPVRPRPSFCSPRLRGCAGAGNRVSRRACSRSSTRSPARQPGCATPATTCSPPTGWPALSTPRCSPTPACPRTTPVSSTSTRPRLTSSPTGIVPPTTSPRCCAPKPPQPLRQETRRAHRRAVHPQRGLPLPLGRPQRSLPPDRAQETPPPGRRRSRSQLRGHGIAVTARAHHARLHRTQGQPHRRQPHPSRQLGRYRRTSRSACRRREQRPSGAGPRGNHSSFAGANAMYSP